MNKITNCILVVSCVMASPLFGASVTVGTYVVGNSFPFGGPLNGIGTRYQEAYASSAFSGPIVITGIDFFNAIPLGTSTFDSGTYKFSLSTIAANINSLSSTNFDSNLGPNNAVFATLTLSGNVPTILTFTGTPFSYNPASGNLLLDIQITNPGSGGTAYFQDGGGSATTTARYQNFGNGTTGFGLVTQFDSTSATPEPATLLLMGAGMLGIGIASRKVRA